jgi:hypothetical protein
MSIQKNVVHDQCGYNFYDVCTCDEMVCAGEDCIYKNISECPVHCEGQCH